MNLHAWFKNVYEFSCFSRHSALHFSAVSFSEGDAYAVSAMGRSSRRIIFNIYKYIRWKASVKSYIFGKGTEQ